MDDMSGTLQRVAVIRQRTKTRSLDIEWEDRTWELVVVFAAAGMIVS